jgi:type I restriction enzyme M protein
MFEQAFKNLDNALHKDSGCSTELDYIEQTSRVMFLKYLDDFEADREASTRLNVDRYQRIWSNEYAWTTWAAPKTQESNLDYKKELTGDELKDFVDLKLFPYLKRFKNTADHANFSSVSLVINQCSSRQ